MAELEDALPGAMIGSLQDQLKRIEVLEQDIDRLEQQIGAWQKQEAACRAIAEVPGIGKLTATALVATMVMRRRSSRVASLLHFLDWCHGKAVPAARSDWGRSQSGATRTCARC